MSNIKRNIALAILLLSCGKIYTAELLTEAAKQKKIMEIISKTPQAAKAIALLNQFETLSIDAPTKKSIMDVLFNGLVPATSVYAAAPATTTAWEMMSPASAIADCMAFKNSPFGVESISEIAVPAVSDIVASTLLNKHWLITGCAIGIAAGLIGSWWNTKQEQQPVYGPQPKPQPKPWYRKFI